MHVLDAILFVLLVIGNVLGLRIGWWLFGTPVVRLWRHARAKKRPWRQRADFTSAGASISP
jgi:hypothetical protein